MAIRESGLTPAWEVEATKVKSGKLLCAFILIIVAGSGCARTRVLIPPRFDLAAFYRVGLVNFTMEDARGELDELATEYFSREIFASQSGIELLELGDMDNVLEETGRERFDPRAAQALGREYDIPAVFVGVIKASPVRPRASISRFPLVEAVISVELTVRMLSTESGATLWSNSAQASETVGGLGLAGRDIVFSAEDPEEAYGDLVALLISDIAADFRPHYR
jgi:hypothetical protein